jgi:hypothetical protein
MVHINIRALAGLNFIGMKKTKGIQLVLITAALASCGRQWIPRQAVTADPADSTLTAAPAAGGSPYDDPYADPPSPCDCESPVAQLWNYSFNLFSVYYFGPVGPGYRTPRYQAGHRTPGGFHGKGAAWRNSHFVVRGGIGKSAHSAGA